MASSSFEDVTGVNPELIGKALTAAIEAHGIPEAELYGFKETEAEVFFSFPGSFAAGDWFAPTNQKPFGEVKMDRADFPCLRSIAKDEDAAVNEAFLMKLKALLQSRSFQPEVRGAVGRGKRIVFTGHSSGGATAILATVWFLEHVLGRVPLCVTFGSPLVGDHVFKHALGRENWSRFFVNFVTRYDIVPRLMLAPKSSIAETLPQILPLVKPPYTEELQKRVYRTVMRNTSAVASQIACQLMGNTNPLLETLSTFIELSPYRPFGTYVFCTSGRLVAVDNADAVLQLLLHYLQCDDKTERQQIAYQSTVDHWNYEQKLQQFSIPHRLDRHHPLLLSLVRLDSNANSPGVILNDLGLGTRGRLSVHAAIEAENQRLQNQESIERNQAEIAEKLDWIENDYKKKGDTRRIGYYDSFKTSNEEDDFKANFTRAELAGIYDDVIEKLKKNQLPDGFEGQEEWIKLATRYRRLVEPLDIANYYRHLKNEDTGPYMGQGRPNRYKCAQRWHEHYEWKSRGTNPEKSYWDKVNELSLALGLPQDSLQEELKIAGPKCESCFWAEVEELSKKPYPQIWVRAKALETMLETWVGRGEIDEQMFLNGSTFLNWWTTLPDHHKSQSPIQRFMKN